jgi:hypothetical protein
MVSHIYGAFHGPLHFAIDAVSLNCTRQPRTSGHVRVTEQWQNDISYDVRRELRSWALLYTYLVLQSSRQLVVQEKYMFLFLLLLPQHSRRPIFKLKGRSISLKIRPLH